MLDGRELASVTQKHGPRTAELLEKKDKYVVRGISNSTPIIVAEAKGAVIRDLDGNTYLDFYGGIGVLNSGHCPQPVVDAVQEQAPKFMHTCFMVTMYEPYISLVEKLVSITPGRYDKKALLVSSGAEAVENAVKIARAYTKKAGVIAFESAFHGRTFMAMSLTSKVKPYKHGFGPFMPEVYKVPSAYCYRCMYKSSYPGCGLHCLEYFKQFFLSTADPDSIAGLIVEPVQGEGGFIVLPGEFLKGLREICTEKGIVFIGDEVQTGFGRTGRMFALDHYGIEPDLITLAKSLAAGMPLSAVVGKAEIMEVPDKSYLGGTYGGNPLSCVAALANIAYLEEQDLCNRANLIGQRVVGKLQELQEKYPQIGDIRALGAMVGVEMVKDRVTKEPDKEIVALIINEALKRGLILISAGIYSNVIRMLMPLVITDAQLEQALTILEESFGAACGKKAGV